MRNEDRALLKVQNLQTRFFTEEGKINAVENVSFDVNPGEVTGIVGESGSGKSVTAMSLLDIVESPGRITNGELWLHAPELAAEFESVRPEIVDGEYIDIQRTPKNVRRSLRGTRFSMIFQDPMTSFDPTYTVGDQIAEAVEVNKRISDSPNIGRKRNQGYGLLSLMMSPFHSSRKYVSKESFNRAIELLDQVGIPDASDRAEEYPHQFSGGMLQRAMIAQALAAEPDILIADEPTSALDVTIQAQILRLLDQIQQETDMGIILITHNLGIIARMCQKVNVMYAGEIVESGGLEQILDDPKHPYTSGLLNSIPDVDHPDARLQPIEGNVPSLHDAEMGEHCYFADRCPKAMKTCLERHPDDNPVDGDLDHTAKCVLTYTEYDPESSISNERSAEVATNDD